MTRPDAFLDTNVLLRHILADHPEQSARATVLIEQIERGDRAVRIADTVVFEAVFTLERFYRVPRSTIRDALLPILELPGIVLAGKRRFRDVFALYLANAGLSFADCYHLILTRDHRLPVVLSFDQKMNRLPGVTRQEP